MRQSIFNSPYTFGLYGLGLLFVIPQWPRAELQRLAETAQWFGKSSNEPVKPPGKRVIAQRLAPTVAHQSLG
jgi:hypothetical protein